MSQELAGKVAIVTGAASGIGRRTGEMFVEEGARVVFADVNQALGEGVVGPLGDAARFRRTDVSDAADVRALVEFTVAEYGGLDIMVNNAGISEKSQPFLEHDLSNFSRIIEVDLLGVMLGTQAAARHMATAGGGSIINTSSIAGTRPGHGFTVYRAAKAGVVNFTQSAAIELGQHLIRVNCICPGNIPTAIGTYAKSPGMTDEQLERVQTAIKAVRMHAQPLKRQGTVDDLANAMVFLASERAGHVTGVIMPVDGGATAGDPNSLVSEINAARARALAE